MGGKVRENRLLWGVSTIAHRIALFYRFQWYLDFRVSMASEKVIFCKFHNFGVDDLSMTGPEMRLVEVRVS